MELAAWAYRFRAAVGLPAAEHASTPWPVSKPYAQVLDGPPRGDLCMPLQSSTRVEGVLYVAERDRLYRTREARLLVAVAHLAAAFLERLRLQDIASRGDALREADRLRTTLISSVSHELKTPLAAMTATVSSLLEEDVAWDAATVRDELGAVRDDLERLHNSIGALLDLARLEADAWTPQQDWYELGEILGTALSHFPAAVQARVADHLPDDGPPVYADFGQLARVFQHLIENALAYAPAGTPIEVGALALGRGAQWWVQDAGPGVPKEERTHIFEKFYRGSHAGRSPSGTGLGLAIAAEIVRFHGGRIWVEDSQPRGARFVIYLPGPSEGEDA